MQIISPNASYELDLPGGGKQLFQNAVTTGGGSNLVFLTQQVDPQGNAVTYNYSTTGGIFRLTSVTDADGNSTSLYYENGSFPNRVTKVVDPFWRTNLITYDDLGYITNLTDAQGLVTSFQYDSGAHVGWLTNMVTPYGTNSFRFGGIDVDNDGYANTLQVNRFVEVTLPDGGKELYVYRANCNNFMSQTYSTVPSTSPFSNTLDNQDQYFRNSFHWGALQYAALSTTDPASLNSTDYAIGRLRHWLIDPNNTTQPAVVLSVERVPSPDRSTAGQLVWYDYPDKSLGNNYAGSSALHTLEAMVLPDTTTRFERLIRNSFGRVTNDVATYTASGGTVALRTNIFIYAANDIDLVLHYGPNTEQVVSNYFNNIYHLPDASSDALNQTTAYLYNGNRQVIRTISPAGLTTTNNYFTSGTDVNRLSQTVDVEISRTNSYNYANSLVFTHTDPRGLVTTNVYDNLSRLTNSSDSRGTIKYYYNKLDLVQVVDRMGFTNSFAYDAVRRMIGKTNAVGYATAYSYCNCGALNYILDSEGGYTRYFYDFAGRMTNTVFADNFSVTNKFNALGQITNTIDSSGYSVTNWFNNQGLRMSRSQLKLFGVAHKRFSIHCN